MPASDPTTLDHHEVKEEMAQGIILDEIKGHLIPHLSQKNTAKRMWDALTKLYQSDNQNQERVLKDKLYNTRMSKGENIDSYLTKLMKVWYEIIVVREEIP